MKTGLITEETKNNLLNSTELKIISITKSVDEARRLLTGIEKAHSFMLKRNISIKLENFEHLLEYRMLIGLLTLDLATAMRMYLNAKFRYEEIFATRQIIVIINEGYKKVYNFIIKDSKGNYITKYREESFWIKDIGGIIENDLPILKQEYVTLTSELESYFKTNFDNIKTQRNLSIHYDKKVVKVYDMFSKLDSEDIFKKMIPFLDILNKMFEFTIQIVLNYKEKSDIEKKKLKWKFEKTVTDLEKFKTSKNETSISKLQESIRNTENIFFKD